MKQDSIKVGYHRQFDDNTIKDNVTVTSSNISINDGRIRILTIFCQKSQ